MCAGFFVEEFLLIKPVSSITQSDPTSRRIELLAIWIPAIGIALCGATLGFFGGIRAGGMINAVGVGLCLAGLALRYWARRVLGRFFTIGVVRQSEHEVIRSGPYRIVRHPAYLAFLLFYLGLPLVAGNWLGLLFLSLPAAMIFIVLICVEDRRLEEELGESYARYKRESARLIPGVW
jgi:protein-S-isoprenylcysteine O-methyltransferase